MIPVLASLCLGTGPKGLGIETNVIARRGRRITSCFRVLIDELTSLIPLLVVLQSEQDDHPRQRGS